jgi:hypothetical protein
MVMGLACGEWLFYDRMILLVSIIKYATMPNNLSKTVQSSQESQLVPQSFDFIAQTNNSEDCGPIHPMLLPQSLDMTQSQDSFLVEMPIFLVMDSRLDQPFATVKKDFAS